MRFHDSPVISLNCANPRIEGLAFVQANRLNHTGWAYAAGEEGLARTTLTWRNEGRGHQIRAEFNGQVRMSASAVHGGLLSSPEGTDLSGEKLIIIWIVDRILYIEQLNG